MIQMVPHDGGAGVSVDQLLAADGTHCFISRQGLVRVVGVGHEAEEAPDSAGGGPFLTN